MQTTLISWTKKTWNPVHGCSKISEECRNCYAESLSLRYGHTKMPWTARNAPQNVQLKPHKLREPYGLEPGTLCFVNSMSDLWHEQVPDHYIAKVFDVMRDCDQVQFQLLTKRPERAAKWPDWPANVWAGCSIGERRSLHKLDALRATPAKTRFVSAEPLLEDLTPCDLTGINWLIVGGESGADYRPMDQAWARNLRDACVEQGVAYFYKQDSGARTEMRPWLVEEDGSRWTWHQMPGDLRAPERVAA